MYGSAVTVDTRLYHTEALVVLHVGMVVVGTVMSLKCRRDDGFLRDLQQCGPFQVCIVYIVRCGTI